MRNSKLDGFGFPCIRCESSMHNLKSCCNGTAFVEGIYRDDDGSASIVHYRCEFGCGFSIGAEAVRDLDESRIRSASIYSESPNSRGDFL